MFLEFLDTVITLFLSKEKLLRKDKNKAFPWKIFGGLSFWGLSFRGLKSYFLAVYVLGLDKAQT